MTKAQAQAIAVVVVLAILLFFWRVGVIVDFESAWNVNLLLIVVAFVLGLFSVYFRRLRAARKALSGDQDSKRR